MATTILPRPFNIIAIWASQSLGISDWDTPRQFADLTHFEVFCEEILRFGTDAAEELYPSILLDAGYNSQLELGLSPHGWRLDIWFPSLDTSKYWRLTNPSPIPNIGPTVSFLNPQHSTYGSDSLYPKALVIRAVQQWVTTQTLTITIGTIPDAFAGSNDK